MFLDGSIDVAETKEDETSAGQALEAEDANQSFCSLLRKKSPLSLWADHVGSIFNASQHPLDRSYMLHDLTAQVLKTITPRLQLAPGTFPRDQESIQIIMKKLQNRFEYLNQEVSPENDSNPPPPVQIMVLGGSVTRGVNCWTGIRFYDYANCAWPFRLEYLINTLAGGELVKVHNLSIPASNTVTGTVMMKYDLLPENVEPPDIVINAFSTSRFFPNTPSS